MNYIQDIELIYTTKEPERTFKKKLKIKGNSIIGITVEGYSESLLGLFKRQEIVLLIDGTDIFKVENDSTDEMRVKQYAWIHDEHTLIENCTIIENLELASQLNQGRSPQLLLKQMEVEMIAEMFPRHLNGYHYIMAGLLSALARGSQYIFINCSFKDCNIAEMENIIKNIKKCNDYFDRTVLVINPIEEIIDTLDVICDFKIVE